MLPRRWHTWGAGGFGEYDPGDTVARRSSRPVRLRRGCWSRRFGDGAGAGAGGRARGAAERGVGRELKEFLAEKEGKRLVEEATRARLDPYE